MFVVRGRDGQIVTSTVWGEGKKEVQYETYEQAEKALEEMELSLPKGLFHVAATECERCGGNDDLTVFRLNGEPKAYCRNCRAELFTKKKPVGRPSVGVTKKVSLTLPEEEWEWLDEQAQGNRSQFLRNLVWEKQSPEREWSNYAAYGYMILAAEALGLNEDQITDLRKQMYYEMDLKTIDEAKNAYTNSIY